jgi:hypothetical protein
MKQPAYLHYSLAYQDDITRMEKVFVGLIANRWPIADVIRQARVAYRAAWAREMERETSDGRR